MAPVYERTRHTLWSSSCGDNFIGIIVMVDGSNGPFCPIVLASSSKHASISSFSCQVSTQPGPQPSQSLRYSSRPGTCFASCPGQLCSNFFPHPFIVNSSRQSSSAFGL